MIVTYAGIVLGAEPLAAIQGFGAPDDAPEIQWAEGLRSSNAEPLARMNSKLTINGIIIPVPAMTLDQALALKQQLSSSLPFSGPLIIAEGATITTYATSVRGPIKIVKEVSFGVSYGFNFTFDVGAPQTTTTVKILATPEGHVITTPEGAEIRIP